MSEAWLALAVVIINYIASVAVGSTSFGDAIVLHIIWGCCAAIYPDLFTNTVIGETGIIIVTLMMYIRLITQPPLLMYSLWRSGNGVIHKKMFFFAVIPHLITSIAAVWLVEHLDPSLLRLIFAVGCFVFAFIYAGLRMWSFWNKRRVTADGTPPPSCLPLKLFNESGDITVLALVTLVFTMALSGAMITLAGAGSPPMMVYMLVFEVPAPICRSTFPLAIFIPSVLRFGYVIYAGMYSVEWIPYLFLVVLSGLSGVQVGCQIGNSFSQVTFSTFVFILLLLAAVAMLTDRSYILVPSLVIGCIIIGVCHYWEQRKVWRRLAELDSALASAEEGADISDQEKLQQIEALIGDENVAVEEEMAEVEPTCPLVADGAYGGGFLTRSRANTARARAATLRARAATLRARTATMHRKKPTETTQTVEINTTQREASVRQADDDVQML